MWFLHKYRLDLNSYSRFGFSNLYDFFRDIFGEEIRIKYNPRNKRYIVFYDKTKLIIRYDGSDKTVTNLSGNEELKTQFFNYLDINEVYQKLLLEKKEIAKSKFLSHNLFGIESQIEEIENIVRKPGKITVQMLLRYRPEAISAV